jgi:hypothetical protein
VLDALGLGDLGAAGGLADGYPTRLHRFRNAPCQVDLKKAVLEGGTFHFDVVFQAELALEGPCRDPLMQELLVGRLGLLAGDSEKILLRRDGDFLGREAREGERDPIGVLPRPGNVVGRPVALAFQQTGVVVEKIEDAVEADARPPQGRKVVGPHSHILRVSNMDTSDAPDIRRRPHRANEHPASGDLVDRFFRFKG